VSYLLDTNAVIALLTNRPPTVRERLRLEASASRSIGISSIVLFELWYGVAPRQHGARNAERLRAFLAGNISVFAFAEEDAAIAGDLRAELDKAGTPIGPYDLLIAAQALRAGTTLVTANVNEFRRVRDLVWQDWTQPGVST
jgi:tRNA(fMet)-specific endonuclease VapC